MDANPTIALAGSVSFSRVTLEALIRHGAPLAGVLGLDPAASTNVSDYARLDDLARAANAPYLDFTKVNAQEVVAVLQGWRPDLLFVVGLSQLVGDELLSIPRMGSIGFHPTRLPEGRGRAPVAWLTWEGKPGAASFFVLEKEADAGAIFVQEPFDLAPGAYAQEAIEAVRGAISRALDRWLPSLLAGEWNPVPQDDSHATFWGRRGPEDGRIDWSRPAEEIERLIRTASRPYPGAYTYHRDRKLIVWRASVADLPFRGVVGRVLQVFGDGALLVQTGGGLLRIEEMALESGEAPRVGVGQSLGYAAEDEIARLKERLRAMEEKLGM
jgi:methionyl-tRNA formyltransferase